MKFAQFNQIKRRYKRVDRKYREVRMIAAALKSPYRPILAHIIPIRRCNLSCGYCSEYDDFSKPVPTELMVERIDHLARLGATAITISGGEPLLHPELETIIKRIREHGIMATLITNGYLLNVERIKKLNRVGLDYLQISIDNVMPDEVSKKSLKVLDQKLQLFAEHAEFNVTVNSVLGSSISKPEDALTVTRRARELGFSSTVGVIHDDSGQLHPLNSEQKEVYDQINALPKKSFFNFSFYNQFQQNLVRGLPNDWHCRAGSRYLYVCEDGLVHYCSQQRGYPGIPLADYSPSDLERENKAIKSCAAFCTVSCVHQVSMIDQLREQPREAIARFFPPKPGKSLDEGLPLPVKVLSRLLVPAGPNRGKRHLHNAILRILRLK
jgi:MoaA/NifB/PqqE/SkfB family radical SAM enzyme